MINLKRERKKRNILKKFRKTKFNYNKFIKNFYLEKNNAYISVKVNDYNDIISKYSIKDYEWLDDEVASFIQENAYYIPIEYNIIVEICGKEFTREEQEIITWTIHTYFGIKLADKDIDLKINLRKGLILILFSILSFFLLVVLSKYFTAISITEPAFILLDFFLWETFDVLIFERNDIKREKLEAAQLQNVRVIFNKDQK